MNEMSKMVLFDQKPKKKRKEERTNLSIET
jgi:hypothetical protein